MTSLFDEADTSNDGKISIDEYLQLTKNYGIEVCFINIIIRISIAIAITIRPVTSDNKRKVSKIKTFSPKLRILYAKEW